jgi:hypothetical protein
MVVGVLAPRRREEPEARPSVGPSCATSCSKHTGGTEKHSDGEKADSKLEARSLSVEHRDDCRSPVGEKSLRASLDRHRDVVLWKLDGLDDINCVGRWCPRTRICWAL